MITTETMLTNAKQWNMEPPVPVAKGRKPELPIKTTLTIEYFKGKKKTINFMTETSKDFTTERV